MAGSKVEHVRDGTVWMRSWTSVASSTKLLERLAAAVDRGHLTGFELEGGTLQARRAWLDGKDLGSFFQGLGAPERRNNARMVFEHVLDKLEVAWRGGGHHGAVHPGNLLLYQGIQLLDWQINDDGLERVPAPGSSAARWMFGPLRPTGWTASDWDLVQLVLTTCRLAKGPQAWSASPLTHPGLGELFDVVGELRTGRIPSSSVLAHLDRAEVLLGKLKATPELLVIAAPPAPQPDLLPKASAAPTPTPPAPPRQAASPQPPSPTPAPSPSAAPDIHTVDQTLDAAIQRVGGRYLSAELEAEAVRLAVERGLGRQAATDRVLVWCNLRKVRREEDLVVSARDALQAGLHSGTVVLSKAERTARRHFEQAGLEGAAAQRRISELVVELGYKSERELEEIWRPRVLAYLDQHCAKGSYRPKDLQSLVDTIQSCGVPEDLARSSAQHAVDQRSLSLKKGWGLW